jgi:hypothetical protein
LVIRKCTLGVVKQTSSDETPDATGCVDSPSVQRVVNSDFLEKHRKQHIDWAADSSDNERLPGLTIVADSGNRDETGNDAVAGCHDVVGTVLAPCPHHHVLEVTAGYTSSASSDDGIHHNL